MNTCRIKVSHKVFFTRKVKFLKSAVLLFTVFSVNAQFKSLNQLLCTADARTSISLQQVDDDWKPVPFDCDNIKVVIDGSDFKREIIPGKYQHCPSKVYGFSNRNDLTSLPVTVMNDNQGIYQVTVSRFDEVSVFKNVKIELDERGCHPIPQKLEVNFDMKKQAKKQ